METSFDRYLRERLKDPMFRREYRKERLKQKARVGMYCVGCKHLCISRPGLKNWYCTAGLRPIQCMYEKIK
jgi:hypothetical protein